MRTKVHKWGSALLLAVVMTAGLSSCIKEEALNSECDITQVSLHVDNPQNTFYQLTDTLQTVLSTDSVITFDVRRDHDADLSTLTPALQVTQGAKVVMTSSNVDKDMGGVWNYRVTSEDGIWHRDYKVAIRPVARMTNDTVKFDFEHYELEPKGHYYVWHILRNDGSNAGEWANGNPGFNLSIGSAKPDEYPTTPLTNGYDGAAVKLTTRSTGPFGEMVNKRIAAGNLFIGTFDMKSALNDAMKATHFGQVFDRQPMTLTGYYTYQPGTTFQDSKGNAVADRTDQAAIYAVLYRNHDDKGNAVTLYGDNVKTSPLIIAIADMGMVKPAKEWTPFSIDFKYLSDIDLDLLKQRGYSLTIVFSSSADGDQFEGAIGSTLCVDKVRLVCKKEE